MYFVNKFSNHVDIGRHQMAFLSAIYVRSDEAPRVQLSEPPAHSAPGFKLGTLQVMQ